MKKQPVSFRSAARASKNERNTSDTKRAKGLTAEELDELFDSGADDIDKHIEWSKAQRLAREVSV